MSRRSGGAGSHGLRDMKDRVQGPALNAGQAENVLEAIRSAADVSSGLDAHAWTTAEMIRVREIFASAAGMKRLRARVNERDATDVRLKDWLTYQTRVVCASGSVYTTQTRTKNILKALRRRFDEGMRSRVAAQAKRKGVATVVIARAIQETEVLEDDLSSRRLRILLQAADDVTQDNSQVRRVPELMENAPTRGLSDRQLREGRRPEGRIVKAPSLEQQPNHEWLRLFKFDTVFTFRSAGSREATITPVQLSGTPREPPDDSPGSLRDACEMGARGPSAADSFPSWMPLSPKLHKVLCTHNGWAVAHVEALRAWASKGGLTEPHSFLYSDVAPTLVRATSGRLMVLELDRVEDPDVDEDLDWIIRLNLMSAEQSAICMDWWALPNLRAQVVREARRSETAAWQMVGASIGYLSARELGLIVLDKLGPMEGRQHIDVIEYNAGVALMTLTLSELDERVRLRAATECWEVPRRVLFRMHGEDLVMPLWSHTEETATALRTAVPHPDYCHFSPECNPYAGRNRVGSANSEQRGKAIEENLAEFASVVESWRELRPKVITVENVASLVESYAFAPAWERMMSMMTSLEGYKWEYVKIRPEWDLAALAARTRIFVYGWRGEVGEFRDPDALLLTHNGVT